MGAAGRDFHVFNMFFRGNRNYEVVAFTATQIPYTEHRVYPPSLSGRLYPKGIPILGERQAEVLIRKHKIHQAVLAYSDLSYQQVMAKASRMMAAGSSFMLFGPYDTMLRSRKPVISVCAVRTGCGKSQTSRRIASILKSAGKRVGVIRHPMPYGVLERQAVQRLATLSDLDKHKCTIEEREEYEPFISLGFPVFAGVDYARILRRAEKESDIILWDGGNNDFSFIRPDLEICVLDPLRAGHELSHYPGEINLLRAKVLVINKLNSATLSQVKLLEQNIAARNPKAKRIYADSVLLADNPIPLKGKRVLAVEDGPSTTHGELRIGAASVYATSRGAILVDPKKYAVGELKKTFEEYSHVGRLLPAMGYSPLQIRHLEATINAVPCDVVVSGTPISIGRLIRINKPLVNVRYELRERKGSLKLEEAISRFL